MKGILDFQIQNQLFEQKYISPIHVYLYKVLRTNIIIQLLIQHTSKTMLQRKMHYQKYIIFRQIFNAPVCHFYLKGNGENLELNEIQDTFNKLR